MARRERNYNAGQWTLTADLRRVQSSRPHPFPAGPLQPTPQASREADDYARVIPPDSRLRFVETGGPPEGWIVHRRVNRDGSDYDPAKNHSRGAVVRARLRRVRTHRKRKGRMTAAQVLSWHAMQYMLRNGDFPDWDPEGRVWDDTRAPRW